MKGLRLVAGSGRSGTTWVLDALADANGCRPVFEPLHPYLSEIGRLYAHRAVTAGEEHPELEQFLGKVAAGEELALWTRYRRQWRWLLPPPANFGTRRDAGRVWRHWGKLLREAPHLTLASWRRDPIVKCIRANLMLDWLARGKGWRVALIVRHPGAVIESELRGSWNADFALDRFRADARLHELTGGRYLRLLERPKTPVESLAARWVIENQWVVERAEGSGVCIIHYEALRESPQSSWNLLLSALELERTPGDSLLAKPSQQSASVGGMSQAVSPPARWQRALTAEQVDTIQRVLDEVECGLYSMSSPNPLLPAAVTPTSAAGVRR